MHVCVILTFWPQGGFIADKLRQNAFLRLAWLARWVLDYEERGYEAARELASRFLVLDLHVGDALRCGLLQTRSARRLGENDAWLAAQALRGGCTIVTRDRRFDDVPGLEVLRY
jgi:predicted nucleic acid-binding protein